MIVRIVPLADHPEALPVLERLFLAEWADYYGPGGPGDARRDLRAYSSRGQLPIGLVAFVGSEPCGIMALKSEPFATHRSLTPWVGAGLVAPQYRRRGIGARLVSALEGVARDLGHTIIYSATSTAHSLLLREGWQLMEQVEHDGEVVSIFSKAL